MSAVYFCGVVFEGGDAFPAFRFIVPVLPALYVLLQEGAFAVASAARRRGAGWRWAPVLGVAFIACGLLHAQHMFSEAGKEKLGADTFTSRMRAVGLALRGHVPPATTIALNPAGAVPYYSGLRATDMLGLVNEHIAHTAPAGLGAGKAGHEKGDGAYILGLRPDLILLGNVRVVGERPGELSQVRWAVAYRSERELARQPDFLRLYEPDAIPLGDGRHLLFMRRRDFEIPDRLDFLARP